MKILILDYRMGDIEVISNVPDSVDDWMDFMNRIGYKDTDVAWMVTDDDFRVVRYTFDPESNSIKYDNENLLND